MKEIFKLPFDICAHPFDWIITLLILYNAIVITSFIYEYINYKLHPPLDKFNCHNIFRYIKEFSCFTKDMINVALFIDIFIIISYVLYALAKIIHLVLFE